MEYIDLGLPSGTLWADENEYGFYEFDEAVEKYGDNLPTREQFEELKSQCQWKWNGSGYDVTGPNDNTIVLSAMGYRSYYGTVSCIGSVGFYWLSTPNGSDDAWHLDFDFSRVFMSRNFRCYSMSIHLVK